MEYGIEKKYTITRRVRKALVINQKVANWIFNKIQELKINFVYRDSYSAYQKLTPQVIMDLLNDPKKREENNIVILSECPEYEECPFEVTHASPYNHRWEGDYDPDAYEDWKVSSYAIVDFFYGDPTASFYCENAPCYVAHPELFDWKETETINEDAHLEDTNIAWHTKEELETIYKTIMR